MNIIKKPSWQISENEVTDETLFQRRREFLKLGAATVVLTSTVLEKLSALEMDMRQPLRFEKSPLGKDLKGSSGASLLSASPGERRIGHGISCGMASWNRIRAVGHFARGIERRQWHP